MSSAYSAQTFSTFTKESAINSFTKIKANEVSNVAEKNGVIKKSKLVSNKKISLKRKRETPTPTSKMVISTIKTLNLSKGAPVEAISEFMGEYYDLNTKSITPRIKGFLTNGVQNGILEKVNDGTVERFKIRDAENTSIKTDSKMVIKSEPKKSDIKIPKQRNPPTSQMVLETIKSLKVRKGASISSIREYIAKQYGVNIKTVTPQIDKFLKSGVEKGLIERVSGNGTDIRFKIKKTEGTADQSKNKAAEKPGLKRYIKTNAASGKKSSPLTPAMVFESIKSLKMRKGVSVESIRQYLEKKYGANLKSAMTNITRYLRNGVQRGIIENVDGKGAYGRFKIRKMDAFKMNQRI